MNKSQYRKDDPYNHNMSNLDLSGMSSPFNKSIADYQKDNYKTNSSLKERSLLSQVHKLRKATATPQRSIPQVSKKGVKNFAAPTLSSKQKSARLEKEATASAKQIISLNQGRNDTFIYPSDSAETHSRLIPRRSSAHEEKSMSQTIYENKMNEKLKSVTKSTQCLKKKQPKMNTNDSQVFQALQYAAAEHFSKSQGKPKVPTTHKKVQEMQKKYIREAERSFKIPEKTVINHRKADEFFREEVRSRERDISRSPTATFHNTKSSRWIENFASIVSDENDYKDPKISHRKDLGNMYLKQNIAHSRKKSGVTEEIPEKLNKIIKKKVEDLKMPSRLSKTEMQQKLRFLHQNLGAVMKGYKCRRIYHNNKLINKYRQDFRDLIHFAYSLKQEIIALKDKVDIENSKRMLLTSLKDLVQKRQQFSNCFEKQLNGKEWLAQSRPRYIKQQEKEKTPRKQPICKKEFLTPHYQKFIDKNATSIYREENTKPVTFGVNTKVTASQIQSNVESPFNQYQDIVFSPERTLTKKDFLKKRELNYDPQKSIEREKMLQKSKSTLEVSETQNLGEISKISSIQQMEKIKSPIRSVKNFMKEYVSPYRVKQEKDMTPTKNFKRINVEKVTKNSFVSKIPKIDHTKSKTTEQFASNTSGQKPTSSSQKFSFIKKKPSNPISPQPYHSRKSSNMDQSLLEMNERIKMQNQKYLKDLKTSPAKKILNAAKQMSAEKMGTSKKSYNRYLDVSSDSDDEVYAPRSLSIQFPQIIKVQDKKAIGKAPLIEATPLRAQATPFEQVEATPVRATPERATPERATPARATPVRATPVRATPVRATPVRATPVRAQASPVRASLSERSPSPGEQYSLSQGSPISPVVLARQQRKYAQLGDSPTGLQRVIDQYSPFKSRNFQNQYVQRRNSYENKYNLQSLLTRKTEGFKLTVKETVPISPGIREAEEKVPEAEPLEKLSESKSPEQLQEVQQTFEPVERVSETKSLDNSPELKQNYKTHQQEINAMKISQSSECPVPEKLKSNLQVDMFNQHLLSTSVVSPGDQLNSSTDFRFDNKMHQVECAKSKIRRRSRGERSVNRVRTPIQAFKEVVQEKVSVSAQKKRLSMHKKSKSPTIYKPVLSTNSKIRSPSDGRSVATSSFHRQVSPNPIKQISSAINQLKDKQKINSPRRQKQLQEMIDNLQMQIKQMNELLL